MRRTVLASVILILGCGGGTATTVAPSPGPEYALQEFMAAVADSNLPKMAEYWGTAKGSAAETGTPPDYPKRIEVIQLWMRGYTYRVIASTPTDASRQAQSLEVQMAKADCVKQVPFLAVKTGGGRWVIQTIDLNALGSPMMPCVEDGGGG